MTQPTLNLGLPNTIIVSPTNDQPIHNVTLNEKPRTQDWCGREVSTSETQVLVSSNSLTRTTHKFFSGISTLASDAPATADVFRKLDQYVLRFFEHLGSAKGSLRQFSDFLKCNIAFIDFCQLAANIDYFVATRFKEKRNEHGEIVKLQDNKLIISGKLAALAASVGGALLWLQEMSFISLSRAAATIGEARLFSFIPKVVSSIPFLRNFSGLQKIAHAVGEFRVFSFIKNFSCLSVTLRAVDLTYALFAIDASRRLLDADNKNKAISASLDLSSYLAELTLSAIVFAGVTNVIGLGVAGTTCITLAVASFIYRVTHENELRQIPQLPLVVAVA